MGNYVWLCQRYAHWLPRQEFFLMAKHCPARRKAVFNGRERRMIEKSVSFTIRYTSGCVRAAVYRKAGLSQCMTETVFYLKSFISEHNFI